MVFLFAFILAVACTCVSARTNCTHNSQCGTGECCYYHVGPMIMSKRRELLQPIDMMHQGGWCEKYKLEGEFCSVFGQMNGHCECEPGLTCQFVPEPTAMVSKRKLADMGPGSYLCRRSAT